MEKKSFENELNTLDFFLLNGIMIPQHQSYIKELDRDDENVFGSFGIDTIDEGLHVVRKRCLTDSGSYLKRLCDYVEVGEDIENLIRRMFALHNVSCSETDRFVKLVGEYQKKFDVKEGLLDTSNMCLYINKNDAKPVVWGRLKMIRKLFGN